MVCAHRAGKDYADLMTFKGHFAFANAITVYKAQGHSFGKDFDCLLDRELFGERELIYREEVYTMFSRSRQMDFIHFDYSAFADKEFPSIYSNQAKEKVKMLKKMGAIYSV